MADDLTDFFRNPRSPRQRQYEALRAHLLEDLPLKKAATQYGFSPHTLQTLMHNLRAGRLDFFPKIPTGPRQRRIIPHVQDMICQLRQANFSVAQIAAQLQVEGIPLGPSTVERVLKDAGFGKLHRRSAAERGRTNKNALLPEPSMDLDWEHLKPFHAPCQVAGLFFFLPYIIDSGIMSMM
jgi:transposase